MPLFYNKYSGSDIYIRQENGSPLSKKVAPGETFNGSKSEFDKFINDPNFYIDRSTDGFIAESEVTTGPDTIVANVDGYILTDGVNATSADAANNTQVTSGNFYSAFGKIRWTDSATDIEHEVDFSITGNGDHGAVNESTFTLGAVSPGGPGQQPAIAGSRIDNTSGKITFAMTGSGARYPEVEVIYELSNSGEKTEDLDQPISSPAYTTRYSYVLLADEGSEYYVAGSSDQVKTSKLFYTGSKAGDVAKTTTFYYQDAANPTLPTAKIEERTYVIASDLV